MAAHRAIYKLYCPYSAYCQCQIGLDGIFFGFNLTEVLLRIAPQTNEKETRNVHSPSIEHTATRVESIKFIIYWGIFVHRFYQTNPKNPAPYLRWCQSVRYHFKFLTTFRIIVLSFWLVQNLCSHQRLVCIKTSRKSDQNSSSNKTLVGGVTVNDTDIGHLWYILGIPHTNPDWFWLSVSQRWLLVPWPHRLSRATIAGLAL